MTTLSLSPSRASDFRTCPQLFKYRAIDRLAEPASEPAVRGSIVHLALERLFEEPAGRRDLTVALDTLDTAWVDYLDDDLRAELFATEAAELESQQTCERFVRNYFELETPSALEPAGREIRLSAEIGGVAVRGILDRVDRSAEGDWIISDYKTGRTPALDRSVRNFFGLEAYAALFHEVFGVVPRQVRLLYIESPDGY